MRNLIKLLIPSILFVCCFITACNKEETALIPGPGNMDIHKSKPIESGTVFTVSPSGNYVDDSYAIQTALNNAADAGAGSTVQLTEGTFYLDKSIEVEGFAGSFRGAGKELTTITTKDALNFVSNGDFPGLFVFRNGDIEVSNLAIRISNSTPTDLMWWKGALPCIFRITGNSVSDPPTTDQIVTSAFNNVKLIGGAGDFYGCNVYAFINISPEGNPDYLLKGGHSISGCEFQTALTCITGSSTSDGSWTIGGTANSMNIFKDSGWAVEISDCRSSYFNFSHNYCEKIYWGGISLCPWSYSNPFNSDLPLSKYLVSKNYFEVEGIGDAVVLWDWESEIGSKKLDAIVSGNKMYLNTTTEWGGGVYGLHVRDVLITNNKIWGNGPVGIYFGTGFEGAWDQCSNWVLKGNNMDQLIAYIAPVILGSGTDNCAVIGGAYTTNVLDYGIDNVVTGVSMMEGDPLGPEIKEAMERKIEMLKIFKDLGRE